MRRIAITGMGVISPLGSDLHRFWDGIRNGRSGIRRIQSFDASSFRSQIAGEVTDFRADDFIPPKEQRRLEPFLNFALAASVMAMRDSGLDMSREDATRAGAIVGSGIGGLQTLEKQHQILVERGPDRNSPFMIPQMIINMAAGIVAIRHGLQGPNYAAVSACATAAHCIGNAMRLIRHDDADIMLAGGAESCVSPLGVAGFAAMKALSTRNDEPERASRPFDAERDGFVMGEGAAIVVLEELERARRRGARIYCELSGFAMTCDAHHITSPVEGGAGAARAMALAMRDGGLTPQDVDYVNAHGTSTKLNDVSETAAIKTAFGESRAREIMVSSTKSMTGHLLGAAAGIETVVCALALHEGLVPPTINYEHPDPECDLDYVPNVARERKIRACLNNALGFGGHNSSMLLRRLD